MNKQHNKCLHFLRKNPGSGFILGFVLLLIICAFLLILGRERIAQGIANWAYLFLVIGVVIKLVRFLKERED